MRQYGELEGVIIADTPERFIVACEAALGLADGGGSWLRQADQVLAEQSWARTFHRMDKLIGEITTRRRGGGASADVAPYASPPQAQKPATELAGRVS